MSEKTNVHCPIYKNKASVQRFPYQRRVVFRQSLQQRTAILGIFRGDFQSSNSPGESLKRLNLFRGGGKVLYDQYLGKIFDGRLFCNFLQSGGGEKNPVRFAVTNNIN